MTITKAEVLAIVNVRLKRSETDIDEVLRSVLYDISGMANFLEAEDSSDSTVVGDTDYSLPSDYKELKAIRLTDSDGEEKDPLEKIDYKTYLERVADDFGNAEPKKFAKRKETIYLSPPPDGIYTINFFFTKYHTNDVDVIEFSEEFREAIYEGVITRVSIGLENWDSAVNHKALYDAEIVKRKANLNENKDISIIDYHDI